MRPVAPARPPRRPEKPQVATKRHKKHKRENAERYLNLSAFLFCAFCAFCGYYSTGTHSALDGNTFFSGSMVTTYAPRTPMRRFGPKVTFGIRPVSYS